MRTKEKFKKVFCLALLSIMLLNIGSICAVEFNPGEAGKDDEKYKEYTATLVDLQINSVMALNLDELSNVNNDDLSLVGSVKINKKIDDKNIEYLNELPQVSLVDEENNIISIAEVIPESEYTMTQSDLYYINLYNLKVQEGKTYYTKSRADYSVVAEPTGNPSTSSYYEKTQEEGKQINFLCVERSAVVTAMDQYIKYFTPDQDQVADDNVFKYRNNNLYGHVYENKLAGVYCSYEG